MQILRVEHKKTKLVVVATGLEIIDSGKGNGKLVVPKFEVRVSKPKALTVVYELDQERFLSVLAAGTGGEHLFAGIINSIPEDNKIDFGQLQASADMLAISGVVGSVKAISKKSASIRL